MEEFGETENDDLRAKFLVNFPNVISRLNNNQKLVTKTFVFGDMPWNISVEMNSFYGCKIVPCFLNCLETKPGFSCKVSFKICAVRAWRASGPPRLEKQEMTTTFNRNVRSDGFTLLTFAKLSSPAEGYIFDDALTLHVELKTDWTHKPQTTKEQLAQSLQSTATNGLIKDMDDLIESGDGDVTFKMKDGGIIKAHKSILCARNAVFAAMLSVDMKEAKTKEVLIEDMGKGALKVLLLYIYTGRLSLFGGLDIDGCKEVVNAAEKYNLQELKQVAGMALAELAMKTPGDAFEHFKFIKGLNVDAATDALGSYIKMNTDEILKKC